MKLNANWRLIGWFLKPGQILKCMKKISDDVIQKGKDIKLIKSYIEPLNKIVLKQNTNLFK